MKTNALTLMSLIVRTLPEDLANERGNVLREVFCDGVLLVEDSFEIVRERAILHEREYSNEIVDRF